MSPAGIVLQQFQTMTPLRRFFLLVKPERRDIFQIYLYALFSGMIYLTLPLGIQAITSFIMTGQLSTSWSVLVVMVILGIVLSGIIQVFQLSLTESLQQKIFVRAAFEFAYRVIRFRKESLRGYYPPELMNRFFDVIQIQKGLSKILIDLSSSSLQIVFGLLLLSFYHPLFIALGFVLILVLYGIFKILSPRGLSTSLRESTHKYAVVQWLQELARVNDTFKLAGRTDLPYERMDTHVKQYVQSRKEHFRVLVWQYFTIILFKTVITGGLLILGSILVVNNQLNLGQFIAAEILIVMVMQSAEKLVVSLESVYDVITAVEKIGMVTDLEMESLEGVDFKTAEDPEGIQIELRNLTYGYNAEEAAVLNDLNLTINAGEFVCISGVHHAGKSTLIQLMAGLFQDFHGNVLYNGLPLRSIHLESLRCYISDSLSQEELFIGTVYENICMGKTNISERRVMEVAYAIGLGDFLKDLPEGIQTRILPGGKKFPKSVVRKIILCRSLVDETRLLLLEDILLHVDPSERDRLFALVFDKTRKRTVVVVSNDNRVAELCDRVVIMEKGRIIDQGPYSSLKKYNSIFG